MSIRILLADDHKIVHEGLRRLLEKQPIIEVIAEAEDGRTTVLTAREREVLQLLTEGKTTKEIAFSLQISVKTVETYRQQIMDKLSIHNVAELTKYAIREGLTSIET
jgi:DNA-binding NarL/FixJ family response regulator